MYANRYAGSRGFKPASLAASLVVNGAVVLALIYAAPNVIPAGHDPIHVRLIPLEPPPPPIPEPQPQPHHARSATHLPTVPIPRVARPAEQQPITITRVFPPAEPVDLGASGGTPTAVPTPDAPALVGASVDPRYAGALQPPYPPAERRAGHEGRVVVRVLIGPDGRVERVEKVSAASDAFFAATRDQALRKWHFKPATRGAVPVESWKTMSLRFVLKEE
jgi:protein TonB